MKDLWKVTAPISAVLTLVVWLFFKYSVVTGLVPFSTSETTFLFAACFAVVATVRWFWRKFHSK